MVTMSKIKQPIDWFSRLVTLSPRFLLLLLIVPVVGGLIGVLFPAFGWAPELSQYEFGLQGFYALWQTAGISQMVVLSMTTGLISTLLAFVITLMILAAFFNSVWLNRIQHILSPILVIPHAAAAIAVGFLIAPSGMLSRLISPWLSNWELAPHGMFPHDPYAISIILGLTLKELPFLLLMALGALAQPHLGKQLRLQHKVALNLGYCPMTAFFKVILPSLYPLLRLPLLAVLAYASSSVEMPLILGPNTPPTLAVAIMHWFNDVDLNLRIKASAGALLQFIVTGGLLALWLLGEKIIKSAFRASLTNGKREYGGTYWKHITTIITTLVILFLGLALIGLVLWSFAGFWRFPAAIPDSFTLLHWQSSVSQIGEPLFNSIVIALASTLIAVILTLLCLESEQMKGRVTSRFISVIIYMPLLIPSVAFLFGLVWIQQLMTAKMTYINVIMAHLLFVLPYVFLSLASSYRQLDSRFSIVAASLGAQPSKVFFKVKLPQLFTPILIAAALGLAISFGQYLPTLLTGAGRISTITTEAITLANGASRRTSSVYALIQMLLPIIGFILAWVLPKLFYKTSHR